jgi:DNA-binding CsgD family transcriptional regulator
MPDERPTAPNATDLAARIRELTAGQRLCLLLVAQHMSSKEIALRLGISPHTVDQRIRRALRILKVGRRRDAALLLLHSAPEPQRFLPFPWATSAAATNKLSIRLRLAWIGLIAIAAALASGLLLAALESVVEMLRD